MEVVRHHFDTVGALDLYNDTGVFHEGTSLSYSFMVLACLILHRDKSLGRVSGQFKMTSFGPSPKKGSGVILI